MCTFFRDRTASSGAVTFGTNFFLLYTYTYLAQMYSSLGPRFACRLCWDTRLLGQLEAVFQPQTEAAGYVVHSIPWPISNIFLNLVGEEEISIKHHMCGTFYHVLSKDVTRLELLTRSI